MAFRTAKAIWMSVALGAKGMRIRPGMSGRNAGSLTLAVVNTLNSKVTALIPLLTVNE